MDFLRQIVAGPRARHPEAGLDLCYVTEFLIATSGPGVTYPQVAYRTPLKDLVKYLDSKHGPEWAIWEFRAEGTGYPDTDVYDRIRHYPWPDHHPPPFALIPLIMASMRNWIKDKSAEGKGRVAVVHCKAGKGRSGTISCSYLISEEGWTPEDAMQRFTERRMRPGFGAGISIPSQVRWIGYVDRWTKHEKLYVERPVEIMEVHVWGLRNGVKIAVEGFVDEGKVIKSFHVFKKSEREIVRGSINRESGFADAALEVMGKKGKDPSDADQQLKTAATFEGGDDFDSASGDVVFRPSSRVVLPSSDVNIDFERRNKTRYGGFTMVTSVAHVWFNTFFEGKGPEQQGKADEAGVFSIDFDAMDGIKGSSRKGTRAFDKMSVTWRAVEVGKEPSIVITEPGANEEVEQKRPADWKGSDDKHSQDFERKLGLRTAETESTDLSRASSVGSRRADVDETERDHLEGVRSAGPNGEALHDAESTSWAKSAPEPQQPTSAGPQVDGSIEGLQSGKKHVSTSDLPGGQPESEMEGHIGHGLGAVNIDKHFESS